MKEPQKKSHLLIGGAIAVALIFSGCQPKAQVQTETPVAMEEAPADAAVPTESAVMVGGAMMLPTRPIGVNAADAPNLTTLISAITQAGLADTLNEPGPYTVFAPTNAAFEKLPSTTWPVILDASNSAQLTSVLTYHVVPGVHDTASFKNGQKLKTVQGEDITVVIKEGAISLKDSSGNTINIETPDVVQSNGVVHVVDALLIPRKLK